MKILFTFIAVLLVLGVSTTRVSAFSSVLGAKTVLDEVRIEGIKVTDPKAIITIYNHTPTFSGYTLSNVRVILVIKSEPIQRETLTDTNGYWSYTLNKSLESGQHTLTIRLVDSDGQSSEEELAATFQVQEKGEVLGTKTEAIRSIPNYWTFTIFVSGSLLLLLFAYLLIRRKAHRQN